jgi:uncharacterized membrane protein
MKPWEWHPALLHFPLAFLLGGVAVDLWAMARPRELLTRAAAGLLVAGVVSGWIAAAAGLLAFLTVPHAGAVHHLMYWHPAFTAPSLALFTALAVVRWRKRASPAGAGTAVLSGIAALLLAIGGFIGGYLVYHGGVGAAPGRRHDPGHGHGGALRPRLFLFPAGAHPVPDDAGEDARGEAGEQHEEQRELDRLDERQVMDPRRLPVDDDEESHDAEDEGEEDLLRLRHRPPTRRTGGRLP